MIKEHRTWTRVLPWMTVYAIAMAFLESAVVVDLRAMYYPTADGFPFPIAPIDRRIAITELCRELATMVMLLAPGALLTPRKLERFAWFTYCFGIWDIFYYVFLKAILDWPNGLLDWDILFLVPVPWVGPVLAPCIVSLGMIAFGLFILGARHEERSFTLRRKEVVLFVLSGLVMFTAFVIDPIVHVVSVGSGVLSLSGSGEALAQLRDFIPETFRWEVFGPGAAIGTWALLLMWRRSGTQGVA